MPAARLAGVVPDLAVSPDWLADRRANGIRAV
jgi:hypothetical protein